jgi:hypothetical protein
MSACSWLVVITGNITNIAMDKAEKHDGVKLVSVVNCLYLIFNHVISVFSLYLDHQHSSLYQY